MKNLISIIAIALLLITKGADAENLRTKPMRILITSGDLTVEAVLNESVSSQDLQKRLPITLDFHRHQSREYYANIRLNKDDAVQEGYQVGDIAYWAPGNSLVLFYDKGYTGNLIIIGKMTAGLNKLAKMGSIFQAKIEKIED